MINILPNQVLRLTDRAGSFLLLNGDGIGDACQPGDTDVDGWPDASDNCVVVPNPLQEDADVTPLKEEDAYPAAPQDAYGWEKLVSEIAAHYYNLDYGLDVRVVRFHNIYGPYGTWTGGREKAPAALARKVAELLGESWDADE